MQQTIVKLDLCGSKNFYDKKIASNPNIRDDTLHKLIEVVKDLYPASDEQFPKGSLYASQGDCVYLILEKPTVALRATVDFMKAWSTIVSELPDCRAVIDYGDVKETYVNKRLELISEAFENINAIEKYFRAGEIAVTAQVFKRVDSTLVQFVKARDVEVTNKRQIQVAVANHENPRLMTDSSLVHALFVASPAGDSVREKAFEALLVEALMERQPSEMALNEFNNWLESRNCPTINKFSMDVLLKHSDYIFVDPSETLRLREDVSGKIKTVRERFESARISTIETLAAGLSKSLGLTSDVVIKRLKIDQMLEEYLCAVFLEIRFMANYFKSTDSLFERLTMVSDFDYILHKFLSSLPNVKAEQFLFLKSEFLTLLRQIATKDNVYIAAIFHNVLMLYYLNRNATYVHAQLQKIREKHIYLDTNTLYALRCKASEYHEMVSYAVKRLIDLGTNICVFDKSLEEYNESLNTALTKYNHTRGMHYYYQYYRPWIWKEYENNPQTYNNSFEYCLTLHRIDPGKIASIMSINPVELRPYLSKEDLENLYLEVYRVKKRFNPESKMYEVPDNETVYHNKVLHDANCLNALRCKGKNPFECPTLFVTCDFRLSKVRSRIPGDYEYLVTIAEFYEFILPYLFLSDALSSKPVEVPNFLLASAITVDLDHTIDFDSIVGKYLASKDEVPQDYEILASIVNNQRFDGIKNKYRGLQELDESKLSSETRFDTLVDVAAAIQEYKAMVRDRVVTSIAQGALFEKDKEILQLKKEKGSLEGELARHKKKEDKQKRYKDKLRRRNKKLAQKEEQKRHN